MPKKNCRQVNLLQRDKKPRSRSENFVASKLNAIVASRSLSITTALMALPSLKIKRNNTFMDSKLASNRQCDISLGYVYSESGKKMEFKAVSESVFSTLKKFSENDSHANAGRNSQSYQGNTIYLNELLRKKDAPTKIDYMSIDTEGSKFDTISSVSFKDWQVSVFTIEHNLRPDRQALHDLLPENGYTQVLTGVSQFDDCYVTNERLPVVQEVFSATRAARSPV